LKTIAVVGVITNDHIVVGDNTNNGENAMQKITYLPIQKEANQQIKQKKK